MRVQFRTPAPDGDRFAPGAFAHQIGKPLPQGGTLLAAEVVEDGAAVLLTMSIRLPESRPGDFSPGSSGEPS